MSSPVPNHLDEVTIPLLGQSGRVPEMPECLFLTQFQWACLAALADRPPPLPALISRLEIKATFIA
jgi:hypothetical protein